jgi:hypothetical protein
MENNPLPDDLIQRLQSVKNKRARVVIDHILKHGFITTEDLYKYGYNHPPRAARDVREAGIPLETFVVQGSDGRRIAAYRFGDLSKIRQGKLGGRIVLSKKLKKQLYALQDGRCAICGARFALHELQSDHRIPYLVAGESISQNLSDYMLVCAPHNRSKSWTCEHCVNGIEYKDPSICTTCYWASPENYTHVATQPERRVDITWQGNEVRSYEKLKRAANKDKRTISDYIKNVISSLFKNKK